MHLATDHPGRPSSAGFHQYLARSWVQFAFFLIGGILCYAPVLNGEFIWDDEYLVGQNPFFRSPVFTFEVFRHYLFFDSFSTYYRPVQNLSYMWDYWAFGGIPFGYHLTNILLHSVSAWLLFRLLQQILPPLLEPGDAGQSTSAQILPFLVAAVWLVHPIHNAAVAYISGRADSLASMFALSAWLLVLKARKCRTTGACCLFSLAAMIAAPLALCSKEIGLMWLLLFLLHLFCFEQKLPRAARLVPLLGAVAVFLAYYFLHSLPGYRVPMENPSTTTISERALLMLRALGDYTGLIFFPARLLMDRTLVSPAAFANFSSWLATLRFEYLSIIGAGAGFLGVVLCSRDARGQRLRKFGALWFAVAFLPISNLFPLNAQVAEHWIYLASIGYLMFVAGCLLMLPLPLRKSAGWVVAVIIVAFGVRTALRAADWSNGERFYTKTIDAGGGTPRIFGNLAAVYAKRGDFTRQEALLRRTLELFPTFATARINLGICLSKQGRTSEAEELLNLAPETARVVASQFPRTWSAALNLAALRVADRRTDDALQLVASARQQFPDTWEVVKYQAELFRMLGRGTEGIAEVVRYADSHWWHKDSWMTLAELRVGTGEREGAIDALVQASRLDIHDPKPFVELSLLEAAENRPEAAIQAQRAAIRRSPDQPSRYLTLAALLSSVGRAREAAEAERQAANLRESVSAPAT